MARATIFYLIACVAISQVSGNGVIDQMKTDFENAKNWVEDEGDDIKQAAWTAVSDYQQMTKLHFGNRLKKIQSTYDKAISDVDASPLHCQQDAKKHLTVLKSAGVGSFFTCSKLIEAAEDIGDIGVLFVDILADGLDLTHDFMGGFSGCLTSWWPWNIVKCWYDRITTTWDDVKRTMADIKGIGSNISKYAHNATVLIEECWKGNTVETDILSVMTPVNQCAGLQIPQNKYKL